MKIQSSINAPSNQTIQNFETFYRVLLPQSFITFISAYNGAIPEKLIISANGQERLVEKFLCLLENPSDEPVEGQYDIGVVITQIEDRLTDDEDLIGANIIPFAAIFGGDFLCMDFRNNPENPNIILWDHNESDELDPVTYDVSVSFSDFFSAIS